jgi:AsmA-like C-terminal region
MKSGSGESPKRKWWHWVVTLLLLAVAALIVVAAIVVRRAKPIIKARVVDTLSERFKSKVELDDFNVTLGRGLEVSGGGLRIYPPDDVVAAGANYPEISIQHFSFYSGRRGLFQKPMHVGTVHVNGLTVRIPPREFRQQSPREEKKPKGKLKIVVDEIVCDDSRLIIETLKPGKDPKDFELQHIVMHDVGPNDPLDYDATLINAIPKGDIHAQGTFGPWNVESPGDSAVTGKYTFDNADLNTIKGIAGTLSSVGEFGGQLNRIEVQGKADVPNFSLDTANRGMPLNTLFEAVVDGTTGDTYLHNVKAKLGQSEFTCSGEVVNVKGQGHITDLQLDVPGGRIQDFLNLAVKTQPPFLTGVVGMKAQIHIPYGKQSVSQKMGLKGAFTLARIHFTNPQVQDKVDMLSLRAQGDPKEAKPGAEDVSSKMKGQFVMDKGKLTFSTLTYDLPGAEVRLTGVYSLDGEQFDFHGNAQTQAKLSQMVANRWKSLLLKAVDPFFTKDGKGAQIPVVIQGTRSEPKFGLDMKHLHGDEQDGSNGKSGLEPAPQKQTPPQTQPSKQSGPPAQSAPPAPANKPAQ